MNVGIIGTDELARILGRVWGVNGHSVCFGGDEKANTLAAAQVIPHASGGTYADAADFGEAVLLTLSWRSALDAIPALAKNLARYGALTQSVVNACRAAGSSRWLLSRTYVAV
jgi:predicted dinucleotide-binding enzyme